MTLRTLRDLDVRDKRVLLREDLNVPLADGKIADYTRVDAALPTLTYLRENGARTIVLSHLGRPDGRHDPKYSLRPLVEALAERLNRPIGFADDCIGEVAATAVAALKSGGILLLENVRFHPGEEQNDPDFAQSLATLGELYVNDAFGTAHRAHASTEGVAHLLPSAAGLLMECEVNALSKLLDHPAQPYVCIIGGAKVKDKVGVFSNLVERVQGFCVGGGMANTFLCAKGYDVGRSLRDDDLRPAKSILELIGHHAVAFQLPKDVVAAPAIDRDEQAQNVALNAVGDRMILDIGAQTAADYAASIERAKTIVFNGPMGVYERTAYQSGTRVIGEAIARATASGAFSVVGGGDAAAAAHELGFASKVSHLSTGGGATLEFLEGKTLPGIAVLQ
ncbi:MAG: phosphoglycerate kinase [Candidatus Eremiobacteraeota bacterium]|nr:phosphoglycerate kinase [Candidatus Eremiobacteraeota bacterium]